jgi:hypothetical protein
LADAFIGQGAAAFIGFLSAGDFTLDAIVTASSLTTSARKVGEIAEINTGAFKAFGDLEATLPTTCNLLKDNDLLLEYSWPQTQKDLDTQTSFLGAGVGFGCGAGNPYLQWGGDNTSTGGTEFTVVDLFKARQEGRYSTATTVTAHAGWFTPSEGAGPATLTVALRNKQTGLLDAILAKTIEPGTQTSCAPTQVGVIDVTVSTDDDPIITYELR